MEGGKREEPAEADAEGDRGEEAGRPGHQAA